MQKFQIPQLRPNQIAIVLGTLGAIVLFAFAFFFFRKSTGEVGTPVTLEVWGTEPSEAFVLLLESYKGLKPNVTVSYKEVDPLVYEDTLLDALAAGTGPDVFTIPSTDVGKMRTKITPAPANVSPQFVQSTFPKAVEGDVSDGGAVYGLPLSLDTLVLLYNRDLLDAAGIASPPATWTQVADSVPRLAALDDQGQIQRAAIALGGTSNSIPEAADILSLLMLQNGVPLTTAAHNSIQLAGHADAAFRFYAQFVNQAAPTYTWSDQMGSSYQQLADGKLAMALAYPSARKQILEINPFVDLRVAPVPQAEGGTPRSYGVYPLLVVSRQTANATWAWDFVQTVTTNKNIAGSYAAATERAAALSSVIEDQIDVPEMQVAATQALQARSWFQWDGSNVRREMDRAVSSIVNGTETVDRAMTILEQRLEAAIR